QIRIRAKGKFPSMLVLYNNVPLFDYANPYSVRVAMYGLEAHDLGVPNEMHKPPYLKDKRFAGERKMTKDQNTCISAVAVLLKGAEGNLRLDIYRNIYADIPLPPELFRPFNIRQFTLEEKVAGKFQDWAEI